MIAALHRLLAVVVVALALLGATRTASADPITDKAAEQKKRGDAAMDALRYTEALQLYADAYAATSDPALLYNMGRVHEALAQYPEALAKLTEFERRASPQLRARVPGLAKRIADVKAKVSTLVLRASVSGARVLLDKKEIGTTPLAGPVQANAGRATLEVIAEGYRPFKTELVLEGGREITIEAALLSKSTSGVLVVESPVEGALVELDGKPAGQVPLETVVAVGAHPLVVSKEGYEPSTRSVVVAADERKTVSIALEKKASITTRWWFWTGVGVLVIGGAVTTYALLTERKADTGTYPPGQVSGPLKIAF